MRGRARAIFLFALLVHAPAATCSPEQEGHSLAVAITRQDGSYLISAPTYEARVGSDGCLHSLSAAGTEMLDDSVSISRGVYLYSGEVVSLPRVSSPSPDTVVASDELFSITYTFLPTEVRMSVRHTSPKPVSLFAVLSPAVALATSIETQESALTPADQPWGTTRFTASSGAFVTFRNGTRVWGPWMGRQVWEDALIPAYREVQVAAVVGKGPVPEPGIAQLVTMTASCPAPGNLFPAGTIPVVHAGIDNRSEHTLSGEVAAKLPGQAPFAAEKVSVAPKSKAGVRFVVPVKQPDVYAVTLAFTVDEEQVATADLSIGYQVDRIKPALSVPKGFSEFWDDVVREARSIPLDVEFTPDDERSDSWILVSKIKYRGVEGEYVSGWYCTPAEKGRYRAMLQLPGYGARRIPVPSALARQGWTVLALDLTGRDPESTEQPPPYLTDGILSPATYSLRRIAAHCIQAVEVLRSQPRVDPDRIAVSGPGLGAALAVTVAALDHRVGAVAADVPLFCDIGEALKTATWPYSEIRDYLRRSPAHEGAVMRTLSFFDALNFAPMVTCPVLIGLGLRDTASPAREVFALYNYLPQGKQVEVYPQAGHEAGGSAHWKAKLDWLDKVLPPQP